MGTQSRLCSRERMGFGRLDGQLCSMIFEHFYSNNTGFVGLFMTHE